MVPQWINDICEKSMKQLMELNRPYKFVGKAFVIQPIDHLSSNLHAYAEDPLVRGANSPIVYLGKQYRR